MDKVRSEDLSDEAHFALWYALAVIGGKGSGAWTTYTRAEANVRMTVKDKKAALERGLCELHEKGLLDLARDGHRELTPVKVHLDKFEAGVLVTGDGS